MKNFIKEFRIAKKNQWVLCWYSLGEHAYWVALHETLSGNFLPKTDRHLEQFIHPVHWFKN